MDEKEFKKHLKDLAHGRHHPEEHDWGPGGIGATKVKQPAKATHRTPAKGSATKKAKRQSK
jgi:hypothetical protein